MVCSCNWEDLKEDALCTCIESLWEESKTMSQYVYIVVRRDDLGIASQHLCFTDMEEAYEYALRKAHEERSNYEWKVIHVVVYEEDHEED